FQHQNYWLESGAAPAAQDTIPTDSVESRFWEAVEREDWETLAAELEVDGDQRLSEVLPVLSSWRRQSRETSTLDGWRYRVTWKPLPDSSTAPTLSGTWLVLAPDADGTWPAGVTRTLTARGASVRVLTPATTD
ncbi:hypothetical protein, partial [Streptomyces barringtoniae]|uniref:hypothetical protein n=1 Tax=Streptomyces barringtoniae TaxID=2892029 RepID=UPI001E356F2E